MLDYHPAHSVLYAQQFNPYSFSFNGDRSQVIVGANSNADPARRVIAEEVYMEANERFGLINKRRIYSREGINEVSITSTSKRFTMTT